MKTIPCLIILVLLSFSVLAYEIIPPYDSTNKEYTLSTINGKIAFYNISSQLVDNNDYMITDNIIAFDTAKYPTLIKKNIIVKEIKYYNMTLKDGKTILINVSDYEKYCDITLVNGTGYNCKVLFVYKNESVEEPYIGYITFNNCENNKGYEILKSDKYTDNISDIKEHYDYALCVDDRLKVYIDSFSSYAGIGNATYPIYIDEFFNISTVGSVVGMGYKNNVLYVGDIYNRRLTSFNVSNRSVVTQKYSYQNLTSLNYIYGVAINPDYDLAYAVSYSAKTLSTFNISNPNLITEKYVITDATNLNNPVNVKYYNDYLYITSETGNSLTIYNVTGGQNPVRTATFVNATSLSGARDVEIKDNLAYTCGYSKQRLAVINVTNASGPVQIGGYTNDGLSGGFDIEIVDDLVLMANTYNDGITMINVSVPTAPTLISTFSNLTSLSKITSMALYNRSILYVVSETDDYLVVFNITNASGIKQGFTLKNSSTANIGKILLEEGFMHLAHISGDTAIRTFDIGGNASVPSGNVTSNCTEYVSGNWATSCGCNVTANTNMGGGNLTINGTGVFQVLANVSNFGYIELLSGCSIELINSYFG